MKNSLLITAISLIIVGALFFTWALVALDFDFAKLSTERYETNTYEITEHFDKISIDVDTTQVQFALSDDDSCKIVCHETEKVKHSATVRDGMLVIDTVDTRKWYDNIGISFGSMKMTVYLPRSEYATLSIDTHTGDVEIPKNLSFERIVIEGNTADITCYASARKHIEIHTDTGDIQLIGVESEQIFLETDTGDVKFENSDAASILVETDTGDVTGTLRSDKVFICDTDTGDIDVPKTTSGGLCEITTDTGDIEIRIN